MKLFWPLAFAHICWIYLTLVSYIHKDIICRHGGGVIRTYTAVSSSQFSLTLIILSLKLQLFKSAIPQAIFHICFFFQTSQLCLNLWWQFYSTNVSLQKYQRRANCYGRFYYNSRLLLTFSVAQSINLAYFN